MAVTGITPGHCGIVLNSPRVTAAVQSTGSRRIRGNAGNRPANRPDCEPFAPGGSWPASCSTVCPNGAAGLRVVQAQAGLPHCGPDMNDQAHFLPWNRPLHPTKIDPAPTISRGVVSTVQHVIVKIAQRLVTATPEAIDDSLADGLRHIADALHLDWAILWRKDPDAETLVPSQSWLKHTQPSLVEALRVSSIPFVSSHLESGDGIWFSRLEDLRDAPDRQTFQRLNVHAALVVPVTFGTGTSGVLGALAVGSLSTEYQWAPAVIEQLHLAAVVLSQALSRKASLTALHNALDELHDLRERTTEAGVQDQPRVTMLPPSRLRDQLQAENQYLRLEVQDRLGKGVIVGRSAAIQRVLEQARQVAATDSSVLLLGETGTGKELIASQIHELSARRGRVMVRVNCSAIPRTLIESELFGREKGAFTGALARQIGRFELADHSTIFLDEIGNLPADVQVKLLRVLEERQVERLGSPTSVHVNVRIIAATHRNLEKRIEDGAFREDLFYRLNVFPIQVPPLRDRTDDIPLLVWRFVDEFSRSFGKRIDSIAKDNMRALQQYRLAGEHPGAAQCGGARDDRDDRSATRHRAAETLRDGARQGQREVGGHRDGACPADSRELQLADPRSGRRRRAPRPPADHARDPHGQAGADAAEALAADSRAWSGPFGHRSGGNPVTCRSTGKL